MKIIRSQLPVFGSIVVICLGALLNGCATGPTAKAWSIKVELDPALTGSSIQVDLVGANAVSLPRWESYSVTSYWTPGDAMRRDADKAVIEFGSGKPMSQLLDAKDPKWPRWLQSGATHLVILADLPGVGGGGAGNADPRRLVIALDGKAWKGAPVVTLRVQESGIKLM